MSNKALNRNLRQHVLDELDWEPSIDSGNIGVAVNEGVVTLSGHVPSYAQKRTAERAVMRVKGVKGLANEIDVQLPSDHERSDADIAKAAIQAIEWQTMLPSDKIKVKVENGWLTLEGTVDWNYQRHYAERTVRNLIGVRGISNLIDVEAGPTPDDVRQRIKRSLERHAEEDADRIEVRVEGKTVTLKGTVRSWIEREDAEHAAWSAPGITQVNNQLKVAPRAAFA